MVGGLGGHPAELGLEIIDSKDDVGGEEVRLAGGTDKEGVFSIVCTLVWNLEPAGVGTS